MCHALNAPPFPVLGCFRTGACEAYNFTLPGCFPYHVPGCGDHDPYGCQCFSGEESVDALCANYSLCGNITDPCGNSVTCPQNCTTCNGDADCQNVTANLVCTPYAFEYSYAANLGCVMPGTGPLGRTFNVTDIPLSIWSPRTLNLTDATAATYTPTLYPQVFECNSVCHSDLACNSDPSLIGCYN